MARNKVIGYKINLPSIKKKISKSSKYQGTLDNVANKKFKEAKEKLIQDFQSHPVTMEISQGSDAQNLSGTLGGYGNLYTFIGFSGNFNPTTLVREFLRSAIQMKKVPNAGSLNVNYSVKVPSLGDFDVAKMPWEGGNNWVEGVENGISGFSYYMSKASKASRSGKGIQINNKLRSISSSSNVKYMSQILNNFKKRIKV